MTTKAQNAELMRSPSVKQTFRNFLDAALFIDSLLKPLRGLILNSCIFFIY